MDSVDDNLPVRSSSEYVVWPISESDDDEYIF